jgi:hypothetical protein
MPATTETDRVIAAMSKLLKRIAVGVWTLFLVAVIIDFINRWLGQNYFSDPNIIIVINLAAFLVQQRWFQFALVFLTGIVVGISLNWFDRKSDEKKASELRTLGSKFRTLSDTIKIQTAGSSGWPNNVREHKADILSVLISAEKFDLWVPDERVYQLPDASLLCEYLGFIGRLLEDGHLDEARREALAWKRFLYKRSNS